MIVQGLAYRLILPGVAVVTAAPVAMALLSLFSENGDIWAHLAEYVLPEALWNTLWLVTGVATLTFVLGVSLAWMVAVFQFPGRRFFKWALLLPMAMPGYVLAFAFAALFEFTGPVQTLWRELAGNAAAFPDIGARAAAIITLGLVLYPYVFLIVRDAFATQGRRSIEVAQSCGLSPWKGFLRVSLPLARPFIVAGVALAVMESLADFGTVKLYNYTTFTTAIYQSWYGLYSLESALQLSLVLIGLVVAALWFERRLRGRAEFAASGSLVPQAAIVPRRIVQFVCSGICLTVFLVAFVLPVGLILYWAVSTYQVEFDSRYWGFAANSLSLATLAVALIVSIALVVSYTVRRAPTPANRFFLRLATLGYAMPGTVLAVGFFVPIAALSRWFNGTLGLSGADTLALQSGLMVILFAYLSRYLAVAHNPLDGALTRIRPGIEDASRSLGVSGWKMLQRVHLPILRPAIYTAMLLVFVDVMKELPITLMTRPFGWDTLSVRVFQLTTEGEWQRAAMPALAIVIAGLLPVMLLTWRKDHAAS